MWANVNLSSVRDVSVNSESTARNSLLLCDAEYLGEEMEISEMPGASYMTPYGKTYPTIEKNNAAKRGCGIIIETGRCAKPTVRIVGTIEKDPSGSRLWLAELCAEHSPYYSPMSHEWGESVIFDVTLG